MRSSSTSLGSSNYQSSWYTPAARAAQGIGAAGYLIVKAPSARRMRTFEKAITPKQKPHGWHEKKRRLRKIAKASQKITRRIH